VRVGYTNLCGDRDLSWGGSWLHEALCSDRTELCVRVGCKNLFVEIDLNCG